MLIFLLLFLIDGIRYREDLKPYIKIGLIFACILIAIDSGILLSYPDVLKTTPIYEIIILDIVAFIKIALFASVGMFCCSSLNISDSPLMRRIFDHGKNVITKKYVLATICVVLGFVVFSFVLFKITSPEIAESLKELSDTEKARTGIGPEPSIGMAIYLLEFAFAEEITFRLGIQNYLARIFHLDGRKYWLAIILASALWSLAHIGVLTPDWVKLVQIFPLGLGLGYLSRRFGIESSIFAHSAFNLVMMFLHVAG